MVKRLSETVIQIEPGDTLDSITSWIEEHSKDDSAPVNIATWGFAVIPGDLILFGRGREGRYMLTDVFLKPEE